jgi:hypothetical protein
MYLLLGFSKLISSLLAALPMLFQVDSVSPGLLGHQWILQFKLFKLPMQPCKPLVVPLNIVIERLPVHLLGRLAE